MRNISKKKFILTMFFMISSSLYSSDFRPYTKDNRPPKTVATITPSGQIVKKIQIVPKIQTIKIEDSDFNFYRKDNRASDKKNNRPTITQTTITPSGQIVERWMDIIFKIYATGQKSDLIKHGIIETNFTEKKDFAKKTQQPRKLDITILPKVPKKFDTPAYAERQKKFKVLNTSFEIDRKDMVKYLNYDLE